MATYNTFIKGIEVPTLDALNSNFLSKTNTDSYTPTANYNPATKKYVDDCIAAINQLHFEIVQSLPATGDPTIIYMISQQGGLGADDYYDEYIYINNNWEKIGSTRIDLSNYYTKTQTDAKLKEYFPVYRLTVNQNGSLNSYVYLNNDCIAQVNAMIADAYARNAPTFAIWLDHRTDATQKTRKGCLLVSNTTNWMETRIERSQQFFGYTQNSTGFRDKNILKYMISFEPKFTTSIPTVNSVALYMVQNDYVTQDNAAAYTPTGNYNPATKKYVDDSIAAIPQLNKYEVTITTDCFTETGSGSRQLNNTDKQAFIDFFTWANQQTEDYYLQINLKNQPTGYIYVSGTATPATFPRCQKDFYNIVTLRYTGGVAIDEISAGYNLGSYANGTISDGTGRCYGTIIIGAFHADTRRNMFSVAVSTELVGKRNVETFALTKTNTGVYTPTGDYNPATKKYVDDAIAAAITTTLGGSA